jgi:hypothetical protein
MEIHTYGIEYTQYWHAGLWVTYGVYGQRGNDQQLVHLGCAPLSGLRTVGL